MYHLELRQFPHVVCRFNQSEAQVAALIVPWVKEEWIEEGERKWNSNEATIKVLEGPKLSMPDLAMGRGWRNAERRSEDVTERMLDAVREQLGGPATAAAATSQTGEGATDPQLLADSLALELLALLDDEPLSLARAWNLAAERLAGASAADSLALAEAAVRSLAARGLVVLRKASADGGGDGADSAGAILAEEQIDAALRAVDGWGAGERGAVQIAGRT